MPRLPLLLPALLALVLAGCAAVDEGSRTDEGDAQPTVGDATDDDAPDAAAPSDAEPHLRVVATVAPVADLVAWVGGDRVEVASLVPAGADSHTYEPRPGDITTLADADAYLGIGLDLNPGALTLAEENLDDDRVIRLGERHLDDEVLIHDHVHAADDGHTHGDDEAPHTHNGDEEHTHAGPNPHVWTGLAATSVLLDGIADTLTELDPEGEEDYARNAAAAQQELEELDGQIRVAVDTIPSEHRTLVVYHDAWSYFARDYGFEMVTAVQPSDFSEPSAGDVRDLIDLLREEDVPALFGSEVFPSDVLDVIGEETGATYVADLSDDVLPGEPGDPEHSYAGLMRHNATVIVEGLGGDASAIGS